MADNLARGFFPENQFLNSGFPGPFSDGRFQVAIRTADLAPISVQSASGSRNMQDGHITHKRVLLQHPTALVPIHSPEMNIKDNKVRFLLIHLSNGVNAIVTRNNLHPLSFQQATDGTVRGLGVFRQQYFLQLRRHSVFPKSG